MPPSPEQNGVAEEVEADEEICGPAPNEGLPAGMIGLKNLGASLNPALCVF